MPKAFILIFFVFLSELSGGQELYPNNEPASSVPKQALGIRVFNEGYKESTLYRSLTGFKLMYGFTPKLSVYATATFSDFHGKTLPFDFISHDHSGGQLIAGTNTPQRGIPYPYIFNSIDLFAKYRFISLDGQNTHVRLAAYAEVSHVAVPAHEAEPDLLVHTSGYSAGVIATYLKRHFAVSLTTGFIVPSEYSGDTYDKYGGIYPTTIQYGKAVSYNLSLGYLLFPRKYTGYDQTNWNIYCEFIGKSYSAAHVQEHDGPFAGSIVYDLPITTPILKAGNYLDINPGVQCIIRSTYRVDFSVGFPLVNLSYNHFYPLYLLGVQRYLFFHRHISSDNSKL